MNHIHINKSNIDTNRRLRRDLMPVIVVEREYGTEEAWKADIVDKFGDVVARVVYDPNKPKADGARVWIETEYEVKT